MEESILNLLFKASLVQEPYGTSYRSNLGHLIGQSVLVINAGILLRTAVLSFLASRGARVVAHLNTVRKKKENILSFQQATKDKGPPTRPLYENRGQIGVRLIPEWTEDSFFQQEQCKNRATMWLSAAIGIQ